MALRCCERALRVLAAAEFTHDGLEAALRGRRPKRSGSKPDRCSSPIRVAVCGRKTAPPLFETLEVLGPRDHACAHRPGHREDLKRIMNPY